ncbi:MAG TPA: hypothetical protein VMJ74_04985 [Pseudomonadales bacterium]|nr:hypothetical protein [Pseudomonadales bacterium]
MRPQRQEYDAIASVEDEHVSAVEGFEFGWHAVSWTLTNVRLGRTVVSVESDPTNPGRERPRIGDTALYVRSHLTRNSSEANGAIDSIPTLGHRVWARWLQGDAIIAGPNLPTVRSAQLDDGAFDPSTSSAVETVKVTILERPGEAWPDCAARRGGASSDGSTMEFRLRATPDVFDGLANGLADTAFTAQVSLKGWRRRGPSELYVCESQPAELSMLVTERRLPNDAEEARPMQTAAIDALSRSVATMRIGLVVLGGVTAVLAIKLLT